MCDILKTSKLLEYFFENNIKTVLRLLERNRDGSTRKNKLVGTNSKLMHIHFKKSVNLTCLPLDPVNLHVLADFDHICLVLCLMRVMVITMPFSDQILTIEANLIVLSGINIKFDTR